MRAVNDAGGHRIYLAGFDVFRLDAAEYGRGLQRACASFGFEGIYPLGYIRLLTGANVKRVFARGTAFFHQAHADNG